MLKLLKLTNFGCHENLTVQFTEGLNVFRAANEAGKSTVLKAIAYALWGARALPAALAETVTWGKPLSSLKVELTFSVHGSDYHVKRSNSGAELTCGELTVTGQTETATFIGSLLGASAAVAQSTLFAAQKDIEASLGSDANGLIEQLAQLDIIPALIDKVREKHPSGATKHLETQLESLVDLAAPDSRELEVLLADLEVAKNSLVRGQETLERLQATVTFEVSKEPEARAELVSAARAEKRNQELLQAIRQVRIPDVPAEPAPIEPLESQYEKALQGATLWDAYTRFTAFDSSICVPVVAGSTGKDLPNLRTNKSKLQSELSDLNQKCMTLELEIQTLTGTCKVCGLDYSTIESVAKQVDTLKGKHRQLCDERDLLSAALTEATVKLSSVEELARIEDFNRRALSNVEFDTTFFPAKPVWVGDVPANVDVMQLRQSLTNARKLLKEYREVSEQANKQTAYLEALQKELLSLPKHDTTAASETIKTCEELRLSLAEETKKVMELQAAYRQAQKRLNDFQAWEVTVSTVNERNATQRQQLQDSIANVNRVNGLLTKLREARPVVANKLWKMLTEAVSATFSEMRGTPAVVSRGEAKGFLVDGKPVAVYSGSTQDILALALRKTLVKVFLPNVDFLILDEPAAGCDENREAALIATVSNAGFSQTLLVTHSDIADSFAQTLVTLD